MPRARILEVDERMTAAGEVHRRLDAAQVSMAAKRLSEMGVEAVAICFLHSYANPEHERRAAEIVSRAMPGVPVSVSSDILPEYREFERFSTTALNAYVGPKVSQYLDRLSSGLTEDDIKAVRARVGENLQARLDNGDINVIAQFAEYHLTILAEPDHNTAYIWYSIAVALNIPDMVDRRDDTESDIEAKDLARLQTEARELFDKYNFAPFTHKKAGGANEG